MKALPSLRQLRYLVALADSRHFGRAAEACLVTQSTLSAGIRELETVLAAALVERTKRRVMLTALGEETVARARDVLAAVEDLAEAVAAAGEPLSGLVRLGLIPTIGPYLLPAALPGLRRAYPRLKLALHEDLTFRLLERLRAGTLDAALIALPYATAGLETADIGEDPFWLACPADHRLAHAPAVSAGDLAGEDLLLLADGHCLREHALAACGIESARRGAPFEATSLETLVQMAAGGFGVTLLPRMALTAGALSGTGLVAVPMAGAARRIGLAWRRASRRRSDFLLLAEQLRRRVEGASTAAGRRDGSGPRRARG